MSSGYAGLVDIRAEEILTPEEPAGFEDRGQDHD